MSATRKLCPPQTGPYKIKIKTKSPGFPEESRLLRLEISVGQPYHEGEKFGCTIDWARNRYDKIIILVNDSLQRFNYMFDDGMNEKEAYDRALHDGTAWIGRNMAKIATLPDFEIYRWDAWKRAEGYFNELSKARSLYDRHADFRNAIDSAIDEIWNRRILSSNRREEFYKLSRIYLLEETAAFSVIYRAFPGVSAYPGSFQEMWEMFLNTDHPGAPEGLKHAHCMRIDFIRRERAQHAIIER